jgi:2-polyprenyl-3-methyl-5-hydroxy-6-metoxy-1,4-benzoquinol methylase
LITWVTLAILKKALGKRLHRNAAAFLQPVKTKPVSIFNRIDFILEQCSNERVLHVGFTDYPFTKERIADRSLLHLQLQPISKAVFGIDIEEKAIEEYKTLSGDANVVYGDIASSYPAAAIQFAPQIILLTEVLEHLKNPHEAIEILYNSFKHGTKVLVTVPNYTALDSVSASLNKTESIHPHHYWYFSPYTLTKLFDDKKFTTEELHFGMYYQLGKKINAVMHNFLYNGDCIMAIFSINKGKQ